MNSSSNRRTHRTDASAPHDNSAAAEATDLEKLDAEARADIDRRPGPRAIFIGVGPNAPTGDRRSRATTTGAMPAKSAFRRMIDAFLAW